jgi:hypothetical protein
LVSDLSDIVVGCSTPSQVQNPAAMMIKLQPLVKEISDYCLERVMSDTKQ